MCHCHNRSQLVWEHKKIAIADGRDFLSQMPVSQPAVRTPFPKLIAKCIVVFHRKQQWKGFQKLLGPEQNTAILSLRQNPKLLSQAQRNWVTWRAQFPMNTGFPNPSTFTTSMWGLLLSFWNLWLEQRVADSKYGCCLLPLYQIDRGRDRQVLARRRHDTHSRHEAAHWPH